MSNNELKTARQTVVDVTDELTRRRAEVTAARERATAAHERISRLIATAALDGVNTGERMEAARAELAEAESTVATWPDIEAELLRRLAAAQTVIDAHNRQTRADQVTALQAKEETQRAAFFAAGLKLLDLAATLRATIAAKEAQRIEVIRAGDGALISGVHASEMPPFHNGWVQDGRQGIDEAKAAWGLTGD